MSFFKKHNMRIVQNTLLIGLLALGALGCKKGGGKGGSEATAGITLPKDTGFVLGISLKKAKETELWADFKKMAESQGADNLKNFSEACGVNAFDAITSVTLVMDNAMDENGMLALVESTLEADKVETCLTKMAESEGKKVSIAKEGNIWTVEVEGESEKLILGWAGKTAVITNPKNPNAKTVIADAIAGKTSVKDNAEMSALLGKVNKNATLWFAANAAEGSKLAQNMAMAAAQVQTAEKPNGFYASLDITKALDASLAVRFPTDKGAKEASDLANTQLETAKKNPPPMPGVSDILGAVKIAANGPEMTVGLKLDEKQFSEMIKMVKGMLAMFGMGGGM